jgi:hypothetical protein
VFDSAGWEDEPPRSTVGNKNYACARHLASNLSVDITSECDGNLDLARYFGWSLNTNCSTTWCPMRLLDKRSKKLERDMIQRQHLRYRQFESAFYFCKIALHEPSSREKSEHVQGAETRSNHKHIFHGSQYGVKRRKKGLLVLSTSMIVRWRLRPVISVILHFCAVIQRRGSGSVVPPPIR